MPASALSTLNSWGVYMLASVGLILLVAPAVTGLYSSSAQSAGARDLQGIQEVVNELRPGMTLRLSYGWQGMPGKVTLAGDNATYEGVSATFTATCRWTFQPAAMIPGVQYSLRLESGEVEVSAVV